jgi:hypothetical protein
MEVMVRLILIVVVDQVQIILQQLANGGVTITMPAFLMEHMHMISAKDVDITICIMMEAVDITGFFRMVILEFVDVVKRTHVKTIGVTVAYINHLVGRLDYQNVMAAAEQFNKKY